MNRLLKLDWVLMVAVLALLVLSTLLVWSATQHRTALTGGDSTAYARKHVINIVIGLFLMVTVCATDHRWVRIVAPLVYVASLAGLVLVNPSLLTQRRGASLLPVISRIVPAFKSIGGDIKKETEHEASYDRTPLRAAAS